jgi:hypothetical protein
MTNLSPAAQAVLDAAFAVEDEWDTIPMIAAALRAAALVPNIDRLRLLAIADELEGNA